MSNVKQLADAEAARAESEPDEEPTPVEPPDEEQEGDDVETTAEPQPSEPTEDDLKAFKAEFNRHERALQKIMGADFAGLESCEECGGLGFRPPVELRTNPKYVGCETCNAYGVVLTGSRAQGNQTQPCPVCMGRGFLEELQQAPVAPADANGYVSGQQGYGTPSWMGNPDVSPSPYVAPVS